MGKRLEEMSIEELWTLFPIVLKEYNPDYPVWYERERERLKSLLGKENIFRISHIGSTAVPGLLSKPTVDILAEWSPSAQAEEAVARLRTEWILMSGEVPDKTSAREPLRLVFNKGYTSAGFAEKVYHLHLRSPGDWDELYFRDYLLDHAQARAEYTKLKRGLIAKYEHDRDGYTAAKGEFVRACTAKARLLYAGRYLPGG